MNSCSRASSIWIALLFSCSIAAARAQAPAPIGADDANANPALMLCLRDGSTQWGTLQAHDAEQLSFVRMDTGGLVRIPWTLLQPEQEAELRLKLGYVDLTGDEVMIDADRLVTIDGVEIIGKIIDRTADMILVKTSASTIPVPKNRISAAGTTIQVRALEVFTKDELYNQRLGTTSSTSASDNWDLARYCERILDFAHAIEHFKKTAELDPSFRTDEVRLATARAVEKAKNQDQIDYLSTIDLFAARKRFDEALALADAFKTRFENSPLVAEAAKKRERVLKLRERNAAETIARKWHEAAGRLARQAAMKLTLEQTMSYLDEQIKKEILDLVSKETQRVSKDITSDDVRKLWSSRKKVHWYRASYGQGTWLLGKDAALKGQEPEKPKDPALEKDAARVDLQQKIARFLQIQEVARKAKSKDEQKDDGEAFWKEFSSAAKMQWILAYYAENSGDMDVQPKPLLSACRDCGGKGTREVIIAGGNVAKAMIGKGAPDQTVECPTCHGLGIVRRIAYR